MSPEASTITRRPERDQLGGWLGAQIGGSCWMLISGCVLIGLGSPWAGAVQLLIFLLANVAATWLWRRSTPVPDLRNWTQLVLVMGVCTLATLVVYDVIGFCPVLGMSGIDRIPFSPSLYGALLVIPAAWIMIRLNHRQPAHRHDDV